MNKKANVNIVCEGVTYEKDKIYSSEQVSHLDQSDFTDTDEPITAEPTANVEAGAATAEVKEESNETIPSDEGKETNPSTETKEPTANVEAGEGTVLE